MSIRCAAVRRLGFRHRHRGFSLVEVLVVMGILALLASLAWPAYSRHVARAKRAAARAVLLEAAQFMERNYATQNTYAIPAAQPASGAGSSAGSSNNLPDRLKVAPAGAGTQTGQAQYTLAVTGASGTGTPDAYGYLLTATPTAADPECGDLTLKHTGERGRSTGSLSQADCWR